MVGIHPALNLSTLINNLKSASQFSPHAQPVCQSSRDVLWETVLLGPRLLRRECRRSIVRDGKTLCRDSRDKRKTPRGGQEATARDRRKSLDSTLQIVTLPASPGKDNCTGIMFNGVGRCSTLPNPQPSRRFRRRFGSKYPTGQSTNWTGSPYYLSSLRGAKMWVVILYIVYGSEVGMTYDDLIRNASCGEGRSDIEQSCAL